MITRVTIVGGDGSDDNNEYDNNIDDNSNGNHENDNIIDNDEKYVQY